MRKRAEIERLMWNGNMENCTGTCNGIGMTISSNEHMAPISWPSETPLRKKGYYFLDSSRSLALAVGLNDMLYFPAQFIED